MRATGPGLTEQQMHAYREQGFLLLPGAFSTSQLHQIDEALVALFRQDSPDRVMETDSKTVRAIHGCHLRDEVCARLVRHPSLVEPALQLLDGDVYVYQFKVNAKQALHGDIWEWHQDYIFWRMEDGLPQPWAINVAVFVDEVNEINGPLILLEGSHQEGMIQAGSNVGKPAGYDEDPDWISNLTADLKYSLKRDHLERLMERYPPTVPKGPAGSILLFHPNLVHASAQNMSPFDRRIVLVTYSHVENRPSTAGEVRPDFLVSRDFKPIEPLAF